MTLRLAGVIRESIVDGPGIRFVVFTQGCPHGCPGCHNPQSHDPNGGYDRDIQTIINEIDRDPLITGVTFSGGDPLMQPAPLAELAKQIKQRGLHLMIYTGFLFDQLIQSQNQDVQTLLSLTDIMIDGLYLQQQRDLTLKFRGSRNQRVVDVQQSLLSHQTVVTEF